MRTIVLSTAILLATVQAAAATVFEVRTYTGTVSAQTRINLMTDADPVVELLYPHTEPMFFFMVYTDVWSGDLLAELTVDGENAMTVSVPMQDRCCTAGTGQTYGWGGSFVVDECCYAARQTEFRVTMPESEPMVFTMRMIQPIPEPASGGLMLIGAAWFAWRKWGRRWTISVE